MAKAKAKTKSKKALVKKAKPAKKLPVKSKKAPLAKKAAVKTSLKKPISKTIKKAIATSAKPKSQLKKAVTVSLKKTSVVKTKEPAFDPKKLRPLFDQVLVQVVDELKKTAGGLFIPDSVDMDGHLEAKVLAVGSGRRTKKGQTLQLDVRVGDLVVFNSYAGSDVELGSGTNIKKLKFIRESDILGIKKEGLK